MSRRKSFNRPARVQDSSPSDGQERQLIYIPVIHTQHDMGSLAATAERASIKKVGSRRWQQHVQAIDEMWSGIRKRITRFKLPYKKVYVYQDGLPVCGHELAIVTQLAMQGSPNHRIVKWLVDRGATVVGTEDPELLIQEYTHLKQILATRHNGKRQQLMKKYKKLVPVLLHKRDLYIRQRIDKTLPPGGIGLLFIGLLHRVDELLPSGIRVGYLIYRLPFRRSFEMEMVK